MHQTSTAAKLCKDILIEEMAATFQNADKIVLDKALMDTDLVLTGLYDRRSGREFLEFYVRNLIQHGLKTRLGNVAERVGKALLASNGWIVEDRNLPEGSSTHCVVYRARQPTIYLVNFKKSKNYGNSANGLVERMVAFRNDSDYRVNHTALAQHHSVEIVIGSFTTERTEDFLFDDTPVHKRFGRSFAALFNLDLASVCFDQDRIFRDIHAAHTINHEQYSNIVPFGLAVENTIRETVERLYYQLMVTDRGKYRGRSVICDHDRIDHNALNAARLLADGAAG